MDSFRIAIDPVWQLPLLLIGATPARSTATLGHDSVELQFWTIGPSKTFRLAPSEARALADAIDRGVERIQVR